MILHIHPDIKSQAQYKEGEEIVAAIILFQELENALTNMFNYLQFIINWWKEISPINTESQSWKERKGKKPT